MASSSPDPFAPRRVCPFGNEICRNPSCQRPAQCQQAEWGLLACVLALAALLCINVLAHHV